MDSKLIKGFIFTFFMLGAILNGVSVSFAQTDEQSQEQQTQQTLDDIHKLVLKMQENSKRLDALEKAVDESNSEAEQAPVPEVPAVQIFVEKIPEPMPVPEAPVVQAAAPARWDYYPQPYDYYLPDSDLFKVYQFEFSSEFSDISYKEPGLRMKENGPFFGIYGGYYWRPEEARNWPVNVLHLDVHGDFGVIDYKSPDAEVSNLKDYMAEPRMWLGHDFAIFDSTRLTPYGGIGFRYLFDHLGVVSDMGGYDRRSEYLYAPVGLEVYNESIPGWEFGFDGEYDIFIRGWQTSYLSNISEVLPNLSNEQTGGFGIKGSFDIIKKMDKINFVFSPFIRYWKIHQSKTAIAYNYSSGYWVEGYEPENNSTEIGAKIGVQF